MRVLAFRHVPFEGLGHIQPALESRGVSVDYVDLYRRAHTGKPMPRPIRPRRPG